MKTAIAIGIIQPLTNPEVPPPASSVFGLVVELKL
jgi:hypothetical protein